MEDKYYSITPVPKPRMVKNDSWRKRPCVQRYWEFKDKVRELGIEVSESDSHVTFVLPMPKSWPKKKRIEMDGKPHRQTPDLDNMCKALLDALFADDSHIHSMSLRKVWGASGEIRVTNG